MMKSVVENMNMSVDDGIENIERRVVLAVMIGLPGSGKTTLVHLLSKTLQKTCLVSHVCIDSLIDVPTQIEMAAPDSEGQKKWSTFRSDVRHSIQTYCQAFLHHNSFTTSHLPLYISAVKGTKVAVVSSSPPDLDPCLNHDGGVEVNARLNENDLVIFYDDNNYYCSMRYKVYQMAVKLGCGFCQIYCQSAEAKGGEVSQDTGPVSKAAMHRNGWRSNIGSTSCSVPTSVTRLMAQRLEPPNPDKNKWERMSISVVWPFNVDQTERISSLIGQAFARPCVGQKISNGHPNGVGKKGFLHEADCILRRLVASHIAQAMPDERRMIVARKLSCQIKPQILDRLKAMQPSLGTAEETRGLVEDMFFAAIADFD